MNKRQYILLKTIEFVRINCLLMIHYVITVMQILTPQKLALIFTVWHKKWATYIDILLLNSVEWWLIIQWYIPYFH